MTVIKLDAATLATIKSGASIVLADQDGRPVFQSQVTRIDPLDRESELTKEEWEQVENDPVEYSLRDAWEKIRRGEKL